MDNETRETLEILAKAVNALADSINGISAALETVAAAMVEMGAAMAADEWVDDEGEEWKNGAAGEDEPE